MKKRKLSIVSKIWLCFILLSACVTFCGCSSDKRVENGNEDATELETSKEIIEICDVKISKDEDYGGIDVDGITPELLGEKGIVFGDSVDVDFSNGYKLNDLPYYNGYYCPPGEALLMGIIGKDYLRISINYGDSLWDLAGLSDGDTATIRLREKEEYLEIQDCCNLTYVNDREAYSSDEIFANFRPVSGGSLKEKVIYRSASPVNNRYKRAAYVNGLIEDAKVRYIVDLADNQDDVSEYMGKDDYNSPYFTSLYEDDKVKLLDMDTNYTSDKYREKIISGLREMIGHEGPILVNCTEGKDRTGFFCAIVEAAAGASYDEIIDDYMKSYENYYGISKDSDQKRYETIKGINIDPILEYITGLKAEDMKQADLQKPVEEYLMAGGLSEAEISALKEHICK